ncbi:MAG: Ig-like domain-containing protein, partial [Gemmatimonadota bacterium]
MSGKRKKWRFVADALTLPSLTIVILMVLFLWQGTAEAQVSQVIGTGITISAGKIVSEISGDWENYGTFEPGTGTVIFIGKTEQQLTSPSGESFYNLTVEKKREDLVLNNSITVEALLELLDGDLDLNGQVVTLGTNAWLSETDGNTVKGESGYITAERYLSPTLLYGGINVAGLGFEIQDTTWQELGTTVIKRFHSSGATGHPRLDIRRYYDVVPQFNSGLNATLVFHYDDSEVNIEMESNLALMRSADGGANWEYRSGTVRTDSNEIALEGIEAFSLWAASAVPRPFCASDGLYEDHVELMWSKLPLENIHYLIYRIYQDDEELLAWASSDDDTYCDETGEPNKVYTYKLVMQDETLPVTETLPLTDEGSRIVFPPEDVHASDGLYDDKIQVRWTDISLVEGGYYIRRDETPLDTVGADEQVYDDMSAVAGDTFSYEVITFTTFNGSEYTSAVNEDQRDDGVRGYILPPLGVLASDGQYPDKVVITWKDQTDREWSYRIYRDGALLDTTAADDSTYTDVGPAPGSYTYCVATLDSLGRESSHACDQGGIDILPPPANVQASDSIYDDKIEITWELGSTLQDGFVITRDGGVLDTAMAQAVSYNDFTVTPDQMHTYCVQAYSDSGGVSTIECDDGFRVNVTTPTDVEATDGDFEDRVEITWESNSTTVILFDVYRNTTLVKSVTGEGRFCSDYGGTAGKKYEYNVIARTVLGLVSEAAADSGHRELEAPSRFQASDDAYEDKILITWADNCQVENGYQIFRRDTTETDSVLIVETTSNRTSFLDETSVPGTTYVYSIAAFDTRGEELGTSIFMADIGRRVLNPPTNVQATDGAYEDRVVVTWDDNSKAEEGYYIYRDGAKIDSTEDNTSSFTDEDPAFGIVHTYRIEAFDDYGQSQSASDQGHTTILPPRSVNASEVYQGSVVITWIDESYIEQGYKILRDGIEIDETEPNIAIYTDTPPTNGVEYDYCVRSFKDAALSDLICDIGISLTGGVDEPLLADTVEASDAAYANRVQIRWKENPSFVEDGFNIYRNGMLIEQTGVDVNSYDDYEARPGQVFLYCVTAFTDAGATSDIGCDYGWRPPDGNITGRINTYAGAGVTDIAVCLEPVPNMALLFDGVGSHVRVDTATVPRHAFTIEFWMKTSDTENQGTPFSYAVPGQSNMILITDYKDLEVHVNGTDRGTSVTLNDGQWHHIAFTWRKTDGRVELYKDGTRAYWDTGVATGFPIPSGGVLILGQNQDTLGGGFQEQQAFRGQMDEVHIWNHVREAGEIVASMTQALTGQEEGLVGYWPLDGDGENVTADLTGNANYGRFGGGLYWTDESAPLEVCATTDLEGNYTLARIRYGKETTFKVTPSTEGGRRFEPAYKAITLSTGNPVQNEVGFIDVTAFTVSGYVKFREFSGISHTCFAEGVEILVDGDVRGVTDINGEYSISLELGQHTIQPRLGDHTFDPPQIVILVEADVGGKNFLDTTTRELCGRVGGSCNKSIGTLTLEFTSENGCLQTELETNGYYNVPLPPQKYLARVLGVGQDCPISRSGVIAFFENLGQREVDLTEADTTLNFIYRAPLQVVLEGFEEFIDDCTQLTFQGRPLPNVPVLRQLEDRVALNIIVSEYYGSEGTCPADTGTVTIYDEISDQESTPLVLGISQGKVHYTTVGTTPSLIDGRVDAKGTDRSFQKALTIVAEVEGLAPVMIIQWVIVEGHVAAEGSKFISAATPDQVLYILRDPPGDGSYSCLEEGRSVCTTIDYDIEVTGGNIGRKTEAKFGVEKEFFVGLGAGTSIKMSAQTTVNTELSLGLNVEKDRRTRVCLTTTERYSTSASPDFVGEDADVFIGAAMNFIFSEVRSIEVQNCQVKKSKAVGFQPNGFKTTFAYTQGYVEQTLIPQLDSLRAYYQRNGVQDSVLMYTTFRNNWQDILGENSRLKREAELEENRSFSAGADYFYSFASSTTESFSQKTTFFLDSGIEIGFGAGIEGVETSVSTPINIHHENVLYYEEGEEVQTVTVGYALSDDDPGDDFTVDVKYDERFPTPVFDVLAGKSSCPYEPWPDPGTGDSRMTPRDILDLNIVCNEDVYCGNRCVPPTQLAVFTLTLSNGNETEGRTYVLSSITTSNPHGAILRANGVALAGGGISFDMAEDQAQEVTLTVERGPTRYYYENLKVKLASACDGSRAVTKPFTVEYYAPCSDVTLQLPDFVGKFTGWSFNCADWDSGKTIELVLSNYELRISEDEYIMAIGAEYRSLGVGLQGPSPWTLIEKIDCGTNCTNLDSVEESLFFDIVSCDLDDGVYEVRAYTVCDNGRGYSSIALGTIDTKLPQVLGTPQPADGILAHGEDISITFNEPILCSSIDADDIKLTFAVSSDTVSGFSAINNTVCDGRTIVIKPINYTFLEDSLMTVYVSGIADLVGNEMASEVSWTFTVNRNQFAWSQASVNDTVAFGSSGSFTNTLVNGSSNQVTYTLASTWLEGDPSGGTLNAYGGTQKIVFSWPDDLAKDLTYTDACTAFGNGGIVKTAFACTLTVVCVPPRWSIRPEDFEHSMNITAEVSMGGDLSDDPNDMVAAFVGDEIRGVAHVEEVSVGGSNKFLAFLTVFSNLSIGEIVRFQVWDNDECRLYPTTWETFRFEAYRSYGTPDKAEVLQAYEPTDITGQSIVFNDGWTWFSTYIDAIDMSTVGVFSGLNPAEGDLVKSQSQFSQFDLSAGWVGTLLELDNISGYMARLATGGTLLLEGEPVSQTTPIPIKNYWNWISYLPQDIMDVAIALDSLTVHTIAKDGDVIKSQYEFAQYVEADGKWIGSLKMMEPGLGYKLYLSKP